LRFFNAGEPPASKIFTHLLQPVWVTKMLSGGLSNKVSNGSITARLPISQGISWPVVSAPLFALFWSYARIAGLKGRQMPSNERIKKAVFEAVDDLNQQLPAGVEVEKSLDAPLYGSTGKLESLDFVTLIMEVEEKINAEFGTDITIADENLLSKEKSPFSTLGTLIEYLEDLLKEADA
jgi:acyl carrier protein